MLLCLMAFPVLTGNHLAACTLHRIRITTSSWKAFADCMTFLPASSAALGEPFGRIPPNPSATGL